MKLPFKENDQINRIFQFLTLCLFRRGRTKFNGQLLCERFSFIRRVVSPFLYQYLNCRMSDDVLRRLTDPNKYTGAHKNRFGADGKGRGIEGRVDRAANDGYVVGFNKKPAP